MSTQNRNAVTSKAVFDALVNQATNMECVPSTKAGRDTAIAAMKGKATEREIAMHFGVSRTLVNTIHKKSDKGLL